MCSNVIKYLFATNSSAHSYNTRNKHKLRAAYGKHNFMYSNFRFAGIKIWNYITDHLDINITLPKFKKMLKIFIQTNDIKLVTMTGVTMTLCLYARSRFRSK